MVFVLLVSFPPVSFFSSSSSSSSSPLLLLLLLLLLLVSLPSSSSSPKTLFFFFLFFLFSLDEDDDAKYASRYRRIPFQRRRKKNARIKCAYFRERVALLGNTKKYSIIDRFFFGLSVVF